LRPSQRRIWEIRYPRVWRWVTGWRDSEVSTKWFRRPLNPWKRCNIFLPTVCIHTAENLKTKATVSFEMSRTAYSGLRVMLRQL